MVGILLDGGGADSPEFATILDHLPASEGEPEAIEGVTFNPEGLLPAERAHWAYDGSLTTPPCTEGVSWFVMSEVTHVSDAQIAQITSVYDHNFRPTQSLNDRKVEGAHFTYEGPDGPDHWGDLSPAWATCERLRSGRCGGPV